MDRTWIGCLARLAARELPRRRLTHLGAGAALAVLAHATVEATTACRPPKKGCTRGNQCCTGRYKRGKCATCANGAAFLAASDPLCWLTWGSFGLSDGQFRFLVGIAVGANGHVYGADRNNHRLQEFDAAGTFVRAWGGQGGDDGQFNTPEGVAVGGNRHVYVADTGNNRIQEFDPTGSFVRAWGSEGSGDGQFVFPHGVPVGRRGRVYVADTANARVVRLELP